VRSAIAVELACRQAAIDSDCRMSVEVTPSSMVARVLHLLGHSRGGAVAINVARQASVMRTLILEDAGGLEPLLADESVGQQRVVGSTQLGQWIRIDLDSGGRRKAAWSGWDALNDLGGITVAYAGLEAPMTASGAFVRAAGARRRKSPS